MTRSVTEVIPLLPHGITRSKVELKPRCSFGEYATRKGNVTLQHEGVSSALFLCDRSEGNGARNVGRTTAIVCTAVAKQQSLGEKRAVVFRCSLTVNDGTISGITQNGRKRESAEFGMCGAQSIEFFFRIKFGNSPCRHIFFQPTEELHHGHPIVYHSTAETLLLARIFNHANGLNGRFNNVIIHSQALCVMHNVITYSLRQHEVLTIVIMVSNKGLQATVVTHLNIRFLQIFTHLGREFTLVNKEDSPRGIDEKIREEHGVEHHVIATQIERPRNFREVVHEQISAFGLPYGFTNARQLACHTFPRKVLVMNAHGVALISGTLAPQVIEGIFNCLKRKFFRYSPFLKLGNAHHFPHEGYSVTLLQLTFQPFNDRGSARYALLHELERRTFQLFSCLNKVARVGP